MMTILILLLRAVIDLFRSRESLEAERLALRQELANLKALGPKRPQLRTTDRVFWVVLSQLWTKWQDALTTVQPDTMLPWRRSGLRLIWPKRPRRRTVGRPRIAKENQRIIRCVSRDNALWGAPRVHGELLKLGIDLSQTTVAKYRVRRPGRPFQTWRTFLRNHARDLVRHGRLNTSKISDIRLLYHRVRFAVRKRLDWILCGSFGECTCSQKQVATPTDKPLRAFIGHQYQSTGVLSTSRSATFANAVDKTCHQKCSGTKRCATRGNANHSPISVLFNCIWNLDAHGQWLVWII